MMQADILDIYEDDMRTFKPLKEWPKIWRQMLSSVDIKELFGGTGDEKKKIGELVRAKFVDRLKVIELIGKHIDVSAFQKDEVHLHLHADLPARLAAGRQRVQDANKTIVIENEEVENE